MPRPNVYTAADIAEEQRQGMTSQPNIFDRALLSHRRTRAAPLAPEHDFLLRHVSEDMADRAFFDHVNPDGDDPFDRMSAAGFAGGYPWGENIALGPIDAAQVVQAWMDARRTARTSCSASTG